MNKALLNSMYRRRRSDPNLVQQLWDAVKVIRCQRQIPTLERIAKYMQRAHGVTQAEVSKQLQYCVLDELLLVRKKKGSKGAKQGVEQEGYELPNTETGGIERKAESHDWYCFQCHAGGDVIPCHDCHRVYHISCATIGTEDEYICTVCQSCDEDTSLSTLKPRKLNRLISMVCFILKDRFAALKHSSDFLTRSIRIGSPGAQMDIGASEGWRVKYLVYRPIDLHTIYQTAKARRYSNVASFLADAQSVVHSVVIYQGGYSDLADKARQMLRDCLSEVELIRTCPSCYEAAILRDGRHWFSKPCRPPHPLVFAGSPYLPAKVVRERKDGLEVVFFGPGHPRTIVDRHSVLPVTTNVGPHLGAGGKSPANWTRAMDELSRHQDMCQRLADLSSSSDSDESRTESRMTKDRSGAAPAVAVPAPAVAPAPKPRRSPPSASSVAKVKMEEDGGFSTDEEKTPSRPGSAAAARGRGSAKEAQAPGAGRKRRGRPPKPPSATTPSSGGGATPLSQLSLSTPTTPSPIKKKRGRPPLKKHKTEPMEEDDQAKEEDEEEEEDQVAEKPKRKEDKGSCSVEEGSLTTDRKGPTVIREDTTRAESPSTTVSSIIKKNEEEIVSSSCMEPQFRCASTQTKLDTKKERASKELIAKLKEELEECRIAHAEELKALKEAHSLEIAATKKKQWCYNCEHEAIYHCCWNTAYCSPDCQQLHWQKEHKRVCRRKR